MEDVRVVNKSARGAGLEEPDASPLCEKMAGGTVSRGGQSFDTIGTDEAEGLSECGTKDANSQSGMDTVLAGNLDPRLAAEYDTPRDMAPQEHDLVELDLFPSTELGDHCWADMDTADVDEGDVPFLDSPGGFSLPNTPVLADILGEDSLQSGPMLFPLGEGDWNPNVPPSEEDWDASRVAGEYPAMFVRFHPLC